MGGSCDAAIAADTVEDMAAKGKEHVHSMEDDEHKALVEKMGTISDEERAQWMENLKSKFEAAPDA